MNGPAREATKMTITAIVFAVTFVLAIILFAWLTARHPLIAGILGIGSLITVVWLGSYLIAKERPHE